MEVVYMDMERTQVYLPKELKKRLRRFATQQGSNVSEVLRQGAEQLLREQKSDERKRKAEFRAVLKRACGMWKDRDPKEFEEIRRSADRRLDEWGV